MKKQILKLGKALSKEEQKNVYGGGGCHPTFEYYHEDECGDWAQCPFGTACINAQCVEPPGDTWPC